MSGMMPVGLATSLSNMTEMQDPKAKKMADNNKEIVKRLVDLKTKRDKVDKEIGSEEEELGKLKEALGMTARRIEEINVSVSDKSEMLHQYEALVQDAEASYTKIVETSQKLIESLDMAIQTSLNRKDPAMLTYLQ